MFCFYIDFLRKNLEQELEFQIGVTQEVIDFIQGEQITKIAEGRYDEVEDNDFLN